MFNIIPTFIPPHNTVNTGIDATKKTSIIDCRVYAKPKSSKVPDFISGSALLNKVIPTATIPVR